MTRKILPAEHFAMLCRVADVPAPVREYRFDAVRKWRFDFCWITEKIAVEIDGGNWTKGGHNTGGGRDNDNEKQNAATLQGWRILRYTASTLRKETRVLEDLWQMHGKPKTGVAR